MNLLVLQRNDLRCLWFDISSSLPLEETWAPSGPHDLGRGPFSYQTLAISPPKKIIVPKTSVTRKLFKKMDSSFPCLIAKRMQETQAIQGVLGLRQVETWTICGWFPICKKTPGLRHVGWFFQG